MWEEILSALVKELETNPTKALDLISQILDFLKAHPETLEQLIKIFKK